MPILTSTQYSLLTSVGSTDDSLFQYLKENYSGTIDDMFSAFLRSKGLTGSVSDMINKWDGTFETPVVIPSSALAAYGGLGDSDNYTLVSSEVSQWNDLSGNERHATQTNASYRPVISNDVGGVPGLLMNGNWSTVEHMVMDDDAVLRGTPFHVGYAIRPASNQQGCLFGDISANRRPFDWWSGAGAGSTALVNAANADFGEVHVNEIMDTPYDNTATKSDIGVDVNSGDTAIVLAKDVDLKAAGGDWLGLGVAATSVNSSTNAAYSLNGHIYGFVTFTDWSDAADALSWLEAQIQVNSAPTAASSGLGFDVGAPS